MNVSTPLCAPTADAAFGPAVSDECRDGFDFTIVFEQSILVILPSCLLVLAAPVRFAQLRKASVKVAGPRLRLAKLVAIAALAAAQLALVVLWATRAGPARLNSVSVAAACVSLASSLMSCALSYIEHARSPRPSSLLNIFLLVSLLLDAALLRTLWLSPFVEASIRGVFTASFALKAVLVVLEAVGKSGHLIDNSGSGYSPEELTGLYGRAVFAWVVPLFRTGFRRLLKPADLFALDEEMETAGLNERFWWHWNRNQPKSFLGRRYRLVWCCILTLQRSLYAIVVPRLALLAFTICQPLVLNRFLIFLDDDPESKNVGYGLVGAYGLVYFGIAGSQALYWHRNGRSVTMFRGILISAVFSKATEISITTADNNAPVTLMSSDVEVIARALKQIHEFWATVIQIAVATWLLSNQIGYAASGPIIVGAVALIGTISASAPVKKYMVAWLGKTQKRIGITSSMISHIKSIKILGLGSNLANTIAALRAEEIAASRPFRILGALTSSIGQAPLLLSPVAAFAMCQSYVVLDVTTLFASLSLVILLAQPLFWMFEVVIDMSAALGAFERIQAFLVRESRQDYRELDMDRIPDSSYTREGAKGVELTTLRTSGAPSPFSNGSAAIEVSEASFAWSTERKMIENVSFTLSSGQFAMLVGPVASGKTTLLKALLGEVPHSTGKVRLASAHVSWCEQSPWLQNQTIRNNIIGYSHFQESLYDEVTKACELHKDFRQLPQGDMTAVGSKGLALSGGQKQRVALARAIYSRPDISLFDDVFSGLDNHTAHRVFRNLFDTNGLLRQWGTTIVLATQSVSFLESADLLISLQDGHVSEMGSFNQLRSANGYVKSLIKEESSADSQDDALHELDHQDVEPKPEYKEKAAKEMDDKRRQLGDKTVYRYYFGTMGGRFLILLLFLEVGWGFLETFGSIWLNFWAEVNNEGSNEQVGYYLGIYSALQAAAVVWFAILISSVLVLLAAKSGIALHGRLLTAVIRAPLSIFTTTDLGSITTRFSQDIGMVDNQLPLALVVTFATFFSVIAKAGLLAASSYYVAISYPFLAALYYYMQRAYLRTSRQLRMLDLEEKAPTYTHFLESVSGMSTIRAFRWSRSAIEKSYHLVDRSQKPFYLLIMAQRSLVLVLDLTTAALALILVGSAVARSSVSVGLTGVSLVQLISLSETMNALLQFVTSLETSISAIARIKHFAEETPEENLPGEDDLQDPPPEWPNQGSIIIDGLSASYGESGEIKALDGVSLEIKPGEKVGVCGRTGSGKSSLMLALLRLLDPSSGGITIDSLPLTSIPRETLRSRLIAISQDQFVLPGTVRQNIDPLDANSTEDIVDALSVVGLAETVESRGGLDATFEEDMLSHGQKQLFFLARAVLRRDAGKIVFLDEATSSVDQATEEMARKVIEKHFKDHTVLAIAHRLDTVVDFDRVVVLEKGCVVEVGPPRELLQTGGRFRALWDASRRSPGSS